MADSGSQSHVGWRMPQQDWQLPRLHWRPLIHHQGNKHRHARVPHTHTQLKMLQTDFWTCIQPSLNLPYEKFCTCTIRQWQQAATRSIQLFYNNQKCTKITSASTEVGRWRHPSMVAFIKWTYILHRIASTIVIHLQRIRFKKFYVPQWCSHQKHIFLTKPNFFNELLLGLLAKRPVRCNGRKKIPHTLNLQKMAYNLRICSYGPNKDGLNL